MTREEAIEILEKEKSYMLSHGGDKQYKALNMAIKALEQEPCEDCVSRQEVIGLFAKNADAVRPYSQTWEEVKALPSVTPKGVTVTDFADRCRECGREKVLDKIQTELIQSIQNGTLKIESGNEELFRIIDKYKVMEDK